MRAGGKTGLRREKHDKRRAGYVIVGLRANKRCTREERGGRWRRIRCPQAPCLPPSDWGGPVSEFHHSPSRTDASSAWVYYCSPRIDTARAALHYAILPRHALPNRDLGVVWAAVIQRKLLSISREGGSNVRRDQLAASAIYHALEPTSIDFICVLPCLDRPGSRSI